MLKHRYLIIKIESSEKSDISNTIINTIREGLKDNFGEYILSKIERMELCEYHEDLAIAIVRCNLEIYKYVCYLLVTIGKLNRINIRFTIISVSGILKKAKIQLLKYLKYSNS